MAGERETTYGMTPRWSTPAVQSHTGVYDVSLDNVGPVGLALALRLLSAGYGVIGSGVLEDCVRRFQAAGGLLASAASDGADTAWDIECHERPGVQPELLARVTEHYRGYGRPRLEFRGSGHATESGREAAVGTLIVRSGVENPETGALQVALDVSPRGLQLIVRGERTLFEAALPLLTVLADRVLYAGAVTADRAEGDAMACELSPRDDA